MWGPALLVALAVPVLGVAQDPPDIRRDSVVVLPIPPRGDTLILADSVGRPPVQLPPDTIHPPLPRGEMPRLADVARPSLRWNRDSLFHTGALNLLDLLERIPGVTGFRTAWLTSPMTASYLGQPGRVRVFFDGLELDPLDPRGGGVEELSGVPIWVAEEVVIERGASEIRVYIQSWRVHRTTPESRVDVGTGDQETNLYRGFLGRRFGRGAAIQFAGQQLTSKPRFGGTSSHSAFFGRLGWGGERWGIEAVAMRVSPTRGQLDAQPPFDFTLPRYRARRTDGYVRVGVGDPGEGVWFRAQAGVNDLRFTGVAAAAPPAGDEPAQVSADSSRSYAQYVLSGGWSRGPFRVSATERIRSGHRSTIQTPSVRASADFPLATVSLFAEGRGADSASRGEIMARVTPLPFIAIGGALGQRGPERMSDGTSVGASSFMRAEAAVRIRELWIGGGLLQRGAVAVRAPLVLTGTLVPVIEPSATGIFVSAHGRIVGPLFVDAYGVQWNDSAGHYRPRYQARSQLYVQSNFLTRFPSGNFGLIAAVTHEYRSHTLFPSANETRRAGGYRIIGGLLEIRIQEAVATYQFRNLLLERYAQVPGLEAARQTQYYGVRWPFWN
jgi:hypothetical protein